VILGVPRDLVLDDRESDDEIPRHARDERSRTDEAA
jgi:hypothetical protein